MVPALIPQERPFEFEKVRPVATWEVEPALTTRFPAPPPPTAEAVTNPPDRPKETDGELENAPRSHCPQPERSQDAYCSNLLEV